MKMKEQVKAMKLDAPAVAATTSQTRCAALAAMAQSLLDGRDEIFAANAEDMKAAEESGVPYAVRKRLLFDEVKLRDAVEGIRQLIGLPDPLGRKLLVREMDEGLVLQKVSVPIGVIGVIFEARPDALIQISALCIKSGNCAVLKGGKETAQTNRVLFRKLYESACSAGMPAGCLVQAELHSEIDELLQCDEEVDLLIPRGSNNFVRYIMEHTKIPVMGHSSGVCHIYADKACDQEKAIPVIVDAKIQYAAACNAVETLLINREIAGTFLPAAARALRAAGVRLRGTQEAAEILRAAGEEPCEIMSEEEFCTEYTDLIISVKIVSGVEEAVSHINRYGSHHTDSILTEDDEAAAYFMQMVDSAGVYRNCSTRFADGFRYGFGAEVGISTGKLHARGPVGLDGLVTYKYLIEGHGHTVGPYAAGEKQFHHRDI